MSDPPGRVLVLGLLVDDARSSRRGPRRRPACSSPSGQGSSAAGSAPRARSGELAGHESDVADDAGGAWAAALADSGQQASGSGRYGRLAAPAASSASLLLFALAGGLALGARGLALSGRKRASAPAPTPAEAPLGYAPTAAMPATGTSASPLGPKVADRQTCRR